MQHPDGKHTSTTVMFPRPWPLVVEVKAAAVVRVALLVLVPGSVLVLVLAPVLVLVLVLVPVLVVW
jgi:hypothetical protein